MRYHPLKLVVDVVLLVTGFVTFGSGLVLLLCFHAGQGAFRASALGATRLTWLNLHRLPALILAVALVLHIALNWKPFLARLRCVVSRNRGSKNGSELVLYVTFWTVVMTGIASLFLIGSSPLRGPIVLERLSHFGHQVIDLHNVTGFVTLLFTIHHVGHRWRPMIRGLRSAWLAFWQDVVSQH